MKTRVRELRTSGSRTALSKSIGSSNVEILAQQTSQIATMTTWQSMIVDRGRSPAPRFQRKPPEIAAGSLSIACQPRYQSLVSPDERKHEARHNRKTGFVTFKCFHLF